ncbi:MAG: DUF4142 domain-containing protein [Abitibacteriaceae bacterium]|nr:DUF4142 domain-containing protein [Abditibacteriaceae bacterium]
MKRINIQRAAWTGAIALSGICLTQSSLLARSQRHHQYNRISNTDVKFISRASQDGLAEVQLGELAQRRGASRAVRDFGRRMVEDHTKANDELIRLGGQRGVLPPTTKGKKHIGEYNRLSRLGSVAFDRAYMHDMVRDHVRAIGNFRSEADHGTDHNVATFASRTLPTLEMHLRMAREIAAQVGS